MIFEVFPWLFQHFYMLPVSYAATACLQLLTVEAALDTASLPDGFCELILSRIVYRVTFDCTGIFALLSYVALTCAFPASGGQRLSGLVLGIPAVAAFSVLRIVILGVVAAIQPRWIEVFHVYVMELATLGFMLFTWMYWLAQVRRA